jgi:hypothetical protein
MLSRINELPLWGIAIVYAGALIAILWLGIIFLSPLVRNTFKPETRTNELLSYCLLAFGVFFALLLCLLAVASYQHYDTVKSLIGRDASSLGALYRTVSGYPEPQRTKLQSILQEYVNYTIDESMPALARGERPMRGIIIMTKFQTALMSFEPTSKGQEILHAEGLHLFSENTVLRRERARTISSGVPETMWGIVAFGISLIVIMLIGLDIRRSLHFTISGTLAIFFGMMIALISAMDQPYRGAVRVDAEPFLLLKRQLMSPQPDTSS